MNLSDSCLWVIFFSYKQLLTHIPASNHNKTHVSPNWTLMVSIFWSVLGSLSGVSRYVYCVSPGKVLLQNTWCEVRGEWSRESLYVWGQLGLLSELRASLFCHVRHSLKETTTKAKYIQNKTKRTVLLALLRKWSCYFIIFYPLSPSLTDLLNWNPHFLC